MHPLLTTLRTHNFDLTAAAASLTDQQLLAAAADSTLQAQLESLINLSRLCLTLQAGMGRHALLTALASTTPDTPAEQRRLANTLARATDTRSLTPRRGGTGLQPVSAAQPPAEPPAAPIPPPLDTSIPPAPMPSSTSSPLSTPPPAAFSRLAAQPAPASILRAVTGAPIATSALPTRPRPP